MRSLRPADRLQLFVLVPLWALCFVLETRSVLRDTAIPPLFVARADSASPGDAYLQVTGLVPWLATAGDGPAVGDRILRVGDTDLRGADRIDFWVAVAREVEPSRQVRVTYERGGVRHEASLRVGSERQSWPNPIVSLAWALVAVLVLLRVAEQPMARVVFQGYLCTAFLFANQIGGSRVEEWIGMAAVLASATFVNPLLVRAALVFPHNDPPRSPWLTLLTWCFAPIGVLHFSRSYGFPLPPELASPVIGGLFILFSVTVAAGATRSYRRADALGRRQMKWLVYGVYLSLLIYSGGALLVAWDSRYAPIFAASEAASIFTPLGFLASIVGYRFLDIDRLLSATASYNVVAVALLGLGLAVVPVAAERGAALAGIDPIVGRNLLCIALAALVVPAQRRLRPGIDRLFFSERLALQEQSALLLQDLGKRRTPEELATLLGERIDALIRPEACVVYAGTEGAFAPIFVAGRAVPPAFEAQSALVATLRVRRKPLALRSADRAELGTFDRAALEALQAEVVVPVRRDEALLAFLCLGPKRSGDVYTATDLSLLAAVAAAASAQLHRFDQEEVIAAGRAMQEALRRYVPGVVAEQIASGAEPVEGEREVSVLFVDIRGYTSFSEGRRTEEIFSTVNRYTGAVSEAVRAEGGAVVEFNGDGMMAVFGSPIELAHKERAAVAAGRAILDAVAALHEGEDDQQPLSVGVGIATGVAFVGSLRAVDRLIWTALGATTNLAARLQALTRELEAPMVVDGATWERLGTGAADFELHPAVSLRGLRHSEDVYALAGVQPEAARSRRTTGVFRKEGDVWRVAYGGREVRLRDQRGLVYLAELLRHPGKEIHSLDLVRAGGGGGVPLASAAAAATSAAARDAEGALSVARGLGGAGETIDARARAAYRARLRELDEELAEAERHHDLGRLELLREEREALVDELADAARGSGGSVGSDAERARVAVTKGLKAATDKIAAAHPELAAHLAAALRRGTFCFYQPDPGHPVEWEA